MWLGRTESRLNETFSQWWWLMDLIISLLKILWKGILMKPCDIPASSGRYILLGILHGKKQKLLGLFFNLLKESIKDKSSS